MADLVIHLPDVDEDGRDYEFVLDPAWLARVLADTPLAPDPAAGAGRLELSAQRTGAEVFVDGRLEARLKTECARCLGPAPVPVVARITALLAPAGAIADPDADDEIDLEAPDRVPYTGTDLVLDDLVREHLVLECPMQPLCAPDCAGIPIPAHVRPPPELDKPAVDPRLQPLKKLMGKLPADKER